MNGTTTSSAASSMRAVGLERLLVGVDGSWTDEETVRQAALLAGSAGALDLVCVAYSRGVGLTAQATIATERAERALDHAGRLARELGVAATTELVRDPDRWAGLSSRISHHDLVVLGGHHHSRAEGILGGSMGTEALHRSPLPVLLARAVEVPFPSRVMLATDGSPDCRLAAAITIAICARHGSEVRVMTVDTDSDARSRHELAEHCAEIFRASGVEPVVMVERGAPRTAIVEAARRFEPSLVVLGSGGKLGIRAIGSVSEHVAHHVPSSVLVARGRRR